MRSSPSIETARAFAARFLPAFDHGSPTTAAPSEDLVAEFINAANTENFVYRFDWPSFVPDAIKLFDSPDGIEQADLETLRKVLTFMVRQARFGEGVLAEMATRGWVARVLRRMAGL